MGLSRYSLYPGQIVAIEHAKVGGRVVVKITKVNPKNVKTVTASGQPWNVHPSFLSEATEAEQEDFKSGVPEGADRPLVLGQAVRFRARPEEGVLVVIASGSGGYRVTKLGGDGNRYWPNVQAEQVEVLNIDFNFAEVGV